MIQLWNMSYQAGMVVCAVLLARIILYLCKAPKKYAYLLWIIPFFRMIIPWSIESVFSLLPRQSEPVSREGIGRVLFYVQNKAGQPNGITTAPASTTGTAAGADMTATVMTAAGVLWVAGILVLTVYSVASYLRLRRKLTCCMHLTNNIYMADHIETAFVMGFVHPRIYLPSNIKTQELDYVIAHEQTHIRRRDYWIKAAAFLTVCVHWFNPLAWDSFILLGRDMEMSCDEVVLKQIGEKNRQNYAKALLEMATGKNHVAGIPLAFGEGNTGSRIQNIMRYKKPLITGTVMAVIVVIVLMAGCLTNPQKPEDILSGGTETEKDIPPSTENRDKEQGEELAPEPASYGEVEITPPTISVSIPLGADGVILDYSDGNSVIYHGYFGLFVYDIAQSSFVGALDLEAINCQYTQGDSYCETYVTADDSKVILHPVNWKKSMYVYDIQANTLECTAYNLDEMELFTGLRDTNSCVEPDTTVIRSAQCVGFDQDSYYGYLQSGSGMLADLYYIEDDMLVELYKDLPDDTSHSYTADSRMYSMAVAEGTLSSKGMTLNIYNNSKYEMSYGEDFYLVREEDGEQMDVPLRDNAGFNDLAYIHPGEQMMQMQVDFSSTVGELPSGTYILSKTAWITKEDGSKEKIELSVEIKL